MYKGLLLIMYKDLLLIMYKDLLLIMYKDLLLIMYKDLLLIIYKEYSSKDISFDEYLMKLIVYFALSMIIIINSRYSLYVTLYRVIKINKYL